MDVLMPVLAPLMFGVVMAVVLGYAALERRQWREALARLASERGLFLDEGGLFADAAVSGVVDGLQVRVDIHTTGSGKSKKTWTRWTVGAPEGLHGASIGSEGALSFLGKALGARDLEIGDKGFDDEVLLSGNEADLRARLDARTRIAVRHAVRSGWTLRDGDWTRQERGRITHPEALSDGLDDGLRVAAAVGLEGSVADRLLDHAELDPEPGVRVRCLKTRLRLREVPRADLERLADGTDDYVALLASRVLQDTERLRRMLRHPTTAVRVQAALTLVELDADHLDDTEGALVEGLEVEPWVERCIAALGAVGSVAAVEALRAHTAGIWPGPRKRDAEAAIRRIQGRRVGAAAGQVSLAHDDEGGGLSVADGAARRGRLSQTE